MPYPPPSRVKKTVIRLINGYLFYGFLKNVKRWFINLIKS